jgi:hypothetical protein
MRHAPRASTDHEEDHLPVSILSLLLSLLRVSSVRLLQTTPADHHAYRPRPLRNLRPSPRRLRRERRRGVERLDAYQRVPASSALPPAVREPGGVHVAECSADFESAVSRISNPGKPYTAGWKPALQPHERRAATNFVHSGLTEQGQGVA